MTDRQSTHGHDCWGWGPRHYECALREIERLAARLAAEQQQGQAVACVACEGKPAPENNPCGWCGRTAPPSAPVGVEAIREAFDEISGLCRHLRQGGPAPEDLQDLSDALDEAVGIAANMLHALAQQPAAVDEAKETDLWRCTVCGRVGTVGRCCGEETRERANMEQLLAENERLRDEVERLRDEGAWAVRWAPGSAYWSEVLVELFGPDARKGIDVLEARWRKEIERAERLAEALRQLISMYERATGLPCPPQQRRALAACRQRGEASNG